MAFATPRRVHFNRDVSKWSAGRNTPSIQRLSSNGALQDNSTVAAATNENDNSMNDSIISTNESNMKCSRNVVVASGNAAEKPSSTDQSSLITVAIRVRPLNSKELAVGCTNSIHVSADQKEITLRDKQNKHFKFTCDFAITSQQAANYASPLGGANSSSLTCEDIKTDSQQQFLYESIGKPLLNKAYEGYNASIFAYGQTGSGKTYSMIGTDKQPGLIPRLVDDLFQRKKQRDMVVSSTHIEISYYEIYNEKIYDLLRSSSDANHPSGGANGPASTSNKHLQIRENPVTGPYIVDLLAVSVQAAADAKTWFDIGNKRRATACTNMNQKSSRSHSVFQIILTQMLEHTSAGVKQSEEGSSGGGVGENSLLQLVTSKIYLVDLAGSERINTSIANLNSANEKSATLATPSSLATASATSSRFKESTCINKSLLTLGKIICLLSDRQQSSNSAPGYLPYRESTLTWLLKESLGGNAKTAMLATVNASSSYFDETLCTLRYAAKTACIKNAAHLNRNFRQKYTNEFGEQMETNLVIPPMSTFDLNVQGRGGPGGGGQYNSLTRKHAQSAELEMTLKLMEQEWKEKLEEAERLKQKEINDLERSLIVLYENETRVQNCCLINLNEDPLLSEKLIYQLKSTTMPTTRTSVGSEEKGTEIVTLVGSDKNQANIHLTGPLIAPLHSRIWTNAATKDQPAGTFWIDQIDSNYVTYVNGEVINGQRQLSHGDRIIFGGSHFFRFNNPLANKLLASSKSNGNACSTPAGAQASSTADANQFKDYQFAKNEIERKQNELMQEKLNEALKKCQQDGDARLQELKQKYERNIETIKNDLEREKNARKLDIEQITTESNKKLKQIVHQKILIETKLNEIEHEMVATNHELDKHERDHIAEADATENANRTPSVVNRRILSKLTEFCSEKKSSSSASSSSAFKSMALGQQETIIQSHANSNGLFGITLKVTEANKICNSIGFDFEFKRHEIIASGGNSQDASNVSTCSLASLRPKPNFIQAICVIDKRLNLATLWNLDTFDYKLSLLRDIYNRYIEEGSLASASNTSETAFITDSTDEWQTLDTFMRQDETFSPRILENALNRNKQCKRRLSLLGSTASTASCNSSINMPKQGGELDHCDSAEAATPKAAEPVKRKCLGQIQPSLSSASSQSALGSKQFDFTMSLSTLNLNQHQAENDQEAQMQMCHSYVFATCRDALNDDDFQSDDEEDDEFDETLNEQEIDSLKFPDDSISTVEEPAVKCVARIVFNIEKLMSQFQHDSCSSRKRAQSQRRESTVLGEEDNDDAVSSIGGEAGNNDQPLYCMKITMLCSQLALFQPNSWCLNGENGMKIRHKWAQISKKIRLLKDTVVDFFQGIGNNVEPMIKSRHDTLIALLADLMFMFGEYVFLSCSNSFLNRDNYILNAVSSKYLFQYAKGVDKQFDFYLNHKAAKFFNSQIQPIVSFIEKMQMFRMNYHRLRFNESSHTSDMVIDYCNYALHCHFRLTNSLKLLQQQIFFKKNNTDKITKLFYNILTDSLALDTISSDSEPKSRDGVSKQQHDGDETKSEHKLSTAYSNESFILAFKELKKYLHEQDLKLKSSATTSD